MWTDGSPATPPKSQIPRSHDGVYKVGRIKMFQDTVIYVKSVEAELNPQIKKLKGTQLSFPGQLKPSPGLTDTVKI